MRHEKNDMKIICGRTQNAHSVLISLFCRTWWIYMPFKNWLRLSPSKLHVTGPLHDLSPLDQDQVVWPRPDQVQLQQWVASPLVLTSWCGCCRVRLNPPVFLSPVILEKTRIGQNKYMVYKTNLIKFRNLHKDLPFLFAPFMSHTISWGDNSQKAYRFSFLKGFSPPSCARQHKIKGCWNCCTYHVL